MNKIEIDICRTNIRWEIPIKQGVFVRCRFGICSGRLRYLFGSASVNSP